MSSGFTGKTICLVLSTLMLSGAMAMVVPGLAEALTSGDYVYELIDGGAAVEITYYQGSGGDVVIPGEIGGLPVRSIGQAAFSYPSSLIASIIIPDNVTHIGNYAFLGCSGLISIDLGEGLSEIGFRAFSECISLGSVTIPPSVKSIGDESFEVCTDLASVSIQGDGTSIGDWAFWGCTSLSSLVIGEDVSSIGNCSFAGGTILTAVSIPRNVTYIGAGPFSGDAYLQEIDVDSSNPDFISVDGVLYNNSMTSLIQYPAGKANAAVIIPNSVTRIEARAFPGSLKLVSVGFPDGLESIGESAFCSCRNLTSVVLPDSVAFLGDYAFNDCTSLVSVAMGDTLSSIGTYAFAYCSSLTTLTLPDQLTSISEYAFYECASLTSITIPDNVTLVDYWAFAECSSLTSLTLGDGLGTIEAFAFYSCGSLTNVTLPSNVAYVGDSAFAYCTSLISIILEGDGSASISWGWVIGTSADIRGHAHANSSFPAPVEDLKGLTMGAYIEGIPSVPRSLTTSSTNAWITLEWNPPVSDGGHPVTAYYVFRANAESGAYEFLAETSVDSFTDNSAVSDHTYWYEICALNQMGEGPRSLPVSATFAWVEPISYTQHAVSAGYTIPVPTSWTVEDDATFSDMKVDVLIQGPTRESIQTVIILYSGYDSSIVDSQAYLQAQVDMVVGEFAGQGYYTDMTDGPQFVKLSNRSSVVFGYDIPNLNVHQSAALVIDAEHKYYWVIISTESMGAVAEIDPIFDTMVSGFVVTSVPEPPIDIILIVLIIVALFAVAFVIVLMLIVLRTKCQKCGKRISKKAIVCPKCGYDPRTPSVMFCEACGARIDAASRQCPNCGRMPLSGLPDNTLQPRIKPGKIAAAALCIGAFLLGYGAVSLATGREGLQIVVIGVSIIALGFLVAYMLKKAESKLRDKE